MNLKEFSKNNRLADEGIYLNEDRYAKPKEVFKESVKFIQNKDNRYKTLIDIGCATGEFIYFLRNSIPNIKYSGSDISKKLIERAKENIKGCKFFVDDINKSIKEPKMKYDIITCLGTLQIFDDIELPLNNLLRLLNHKGRIIIQGSFNDNPVDVITRYRIAGDQKENWQSGWNLYCEQSYNKVLNSSKYKLSYNWYNFDMPFGIKKTDDAMRAWTIKTEKNNFQQVNGLSQLVTKKFLVIDKV